jgi:hypothetical protein
LSGTKFQDATESGTKEIIMTDILSPEEQQSFHDAAKLVDNLKLKVRILEITFWIMAAISFVVVAVLVMDIWGWI